MSSNANGFIINRYHFFIKLVNPELGKCVNIEHVVRTDKWGIGVKLTTVDLTA